MLSRIFENSVRRGKQIKCTFIRSQTTEAAAAEPTPVSNSTESSVTVFDSRLYEDEKKDVLVMMDEDVEKEVYVAWDGEVWDRERIARNVSRMRPHIRNRMFHVNKVNQPLFQIQEQKNYQRKVYARYGRESGVNPGIMWPSIEEIEQLKTFENETLQIPTLQESWRRVREKRTAEEDAIRKRDEEVSKNMAKMDAEVKAFRDRQRKAEEAILTEKKKREKLMEEAKEVLGYQIDPRDKRFEELIAAKEKEQKKLEKAQKKKEKEAKAIARLAASVDTEPSS